MNVAFKASPAYQTNSSIPTFTAQDKVSCPDCCYTNMYIMGPKQTNFEGETSRVRGSLGTIIDLKIALRGLPFSSLQVTHSNQVH